MKSKAPVMKDVAARAGCSVMTVSMALRNHSRVSEATRQRIQALADEMGYRPNPLVSALVAQRRNPGGSDRGNVLAVLTKDNTPVRNRDDHGDFYGMLWDGLRSRADELGFGLEEFHVHGPKAPTAPQLTRILRTRGILGVVLFPGGPLTRPYPDLDWRHFTTVAAAFHARRTLVHRTASDHAHALEIALAELEKRGYRRIGLAMTRRLDPLLRFALSGRYLAWRQQVDPDRRIGFIDARGNDATSGELMQWIKAERPDAVLSLDPLHLDWMRVAGLRVPEDIGFLLLAKREPSSTCGIDLRTRDVGRTAIDLLVRELYLNRVGLPAIADVVLVAGKWSGGDTLRMSGDG